MNACIHGTAGRRIHKADALHRAGTQWRRDEAVQKAIFNLILDSSMVEHSAVNRVVVGSSPTRGVLIMLHHVHYDNMCRYGSIGRAADL